MLRPYLALLVIAYALLEDLPANRVWTPRRATGDRFWKERRESDTISPRDTTHTAESVNGWSNPRILVA